ncbi:hypothetical protein BH20ACT16_BH20ACT16_04090 [soil metagenome]
MTGRIGAKGQVLLPKAIRDRANLHPGDEVDIELRDEEIVLVARHSPARLGGRFANSGMAARLLIDRAAELPRRLPGVTPCEGLRTAPAEAGAIT